MTTRETGRWHPGGPITKSMGVNHTILPPDGTHKDSRIRGVTPCVGYKDTDTGAIIPSPAATAAGCSSIEFVRTPNSYAVGRQNVDFGVRQPGAYRFDMALSKNFGIAEGFQDPPWGSIESADSCRSSQCLQSPGLGRRLQQRSNQHRLGNHWEGTQRTNQRTAVSSTVSQVELVVRKAGPAENGPGQIFTAKSDKETSDHCKFRSSAQRAPPAA